MKASITRESLREELGNNLQIGLGAGLIGGALLGFLAAAATLALNPVLLRSFGDVIRLLLGLQFVYAIGCLALGLIGASIKTLVFLATGRQLSDTKTAAGVAGFAFFLLGALYGFSWCRWHEIGGLAPDSPLRFRDLPVLLAIALVAALLARLMAYAFYILIVYVKKPELRRPGDLRRTGFVLFYMAIVFALSVAVMRFTSKPPAAQSGLTRETIHPTGRQVRLLGTDGMDAEDVRWLRSRGHLGWAERLLQGVRAAVEVPAGGVPPMVWTIVATGKDLAAHGVVDYQTQVVKGLKTTLRIGPNQVGIFDLFHTVLPFFHMTRSEPIKSYMRESKGLWNMAAEARLRVVAVNWWVSWPAERVRGAVVSDHAWLKLTGPIAAEEAGAEASAASQTAARAAASVLIPEDGMVGAMTPLRPDGEPLLLERETWPPRLLMELSPLAGLDGADSLPRLELSDSLCARYGPPPAPEALAVFRRVGLPIDILRSDLFYAQSAALLLDRENPDLWMLHLPGPDILRRVLQIRYPRPAEREAARREALEAYWATLDPAVAACVRSREDGNRDTRLLWLTLPGKPWPDADAGPRAGMLAVTGGGGNASGRMLPSPVQLSEIAPTVLWLLGLPVARDMDGSPRTDALAADAEGVRWIASYGRQQAEGLEQAAGTLDQEMLERFRSLGYIR
jgi:hypothetical protein